MEPRYFACTDCRIYREVDPCACRLLEHPYPIPLGTSLDIDRILLEHGLFSRFADADSALGESLRAIQTFLENHRAHSVLFLEKNNLPDDYHLNWLKVGGSPDSSPRFYVEVLKMPNWEYVLKWREALGKRWNNDKDREAFRQAFEEHLERFRRESR